VSIELPGRESIVLTVKQAIVEDVGSGDITSQLIPTDSQSNAELFTREPIILSGRAWFDETFAQIDTNCLIDWQAKDGDSLKPGTILCCINGNTRSILTAERVAMNFLQMLSGIATTAKRYADLTSQSKTKVLDTRKTIPGLRRAQKYAVACGGCTNHRFGLYDALLIKENHILAAGSISKAIVASQKKYPDKVIEIEVENLDELQQALRAGAARILLDNFDIDQIGEAVSITQGKAKLEASGNITLENIAAIAATGINYISVGALTKHITAADLSLRFKS